MERLVMMASKRWMTGLVLAMAVAFGFSAASKAESFKFGATAPLSGGGADYGIAFENGVKMAAAEINKAGGATIDGKKYTVDPVFCDDEFKPDKAVNCGKELSAQQKVHVIMTSSSLAAFPMMGFNQQAGFVLMATSQTPKFTAMGNKLAVRFSNNTDRTMGPWVNLINQYLEKSGKPIKKVAVMEVNTELGKSWSDNFIKAWAKLPGGKVTGKASYDANATDFYPQLSALLPGEPDAIVLTTVCQPSAIVIKQARELGFKGPFINSAACSGEELVKLLPPEQIEGTLFELSAWGFSNPTIDAFRKNYEANYHALPQLISGLGYEGTRWLARAVEKAGTIDDAAKIRAAMPAALAERKNMLNMANLDENGDMDIPMYVGVMHDGKITVFAGDH
jgi:branched-chain amino acid transport system substrate-binding protein